MTIKRTSNGDRFLARVRRQGSPGISKTFTLKKDALRWIRSQESVIENGGTPEHSPRRGKPATAQGSNTIGTLADILRVRAASEDQRKSGKIERILITAWMTRNAYSDWRSTPLDKLEASHLVWFRDHELARGVMTSTVSRQLNIVLATINAAREAGAPIRDIKVKRPKSPPARSVTVTVEQEALLINRAREDGNHALADLVEFLVCSAMRSSEATGLKWRDVDMDRRIARLHDGATKTGVGRDVPLGKRAVSILERLSAVDHGPNDPVFSLSSERLKRGFIRLRDSVKLHAVHCHDLRATCLSRLAAQNWPVHKLQLVSGHATSAMLDRYVRLRADQIVNDLP